MSKITKRRGATVVERDGAYVPVEYDVPLTAYDIDRIERALGDFLDFSIDEYDEEHEQYTDLHEKFAVLDMLDSTETCMVCAHRNANKCMALGITVNTSTPACVRQERDEIPF